MEYILFGLVTAGCCLILITWLRVDQLAQERDLDAKYFEWYM